MMDQQLRVLVALVKDLGWFAVSTRLTCDPVTPVPGNDTPFCPLMSLESIKRHPSAFYCYGVDLPFLKLYENTSIQYVLFCLASLT